MTTQNTAANVATETSSSVVVPVQAVKRITANSILFAPQPEIVLGEGQEAPTKEQNAELKTAVTEFVAAQAKSLTTLIIEKTTGGDVVLAILKETAKQYPSVLAELLKAKAEQEAKDEENRQREAAEREAAAKVEAERLETEKNAMLQKLLDAGIDADTAAIAVAGYGKKKMATTGGVYPRVNVTVDGKQYDIPQRGNMSEALKELVAAQGFKDDREGFINKFRTEPAAETETAAE